MTRLLGGDESIGVVTFARFYGIARPAVATGHRLLDRHARISGPEAWRGAVPGDESLPPKKFYPQQVLKDTIAIFVAFSILFVMAIAVRVPLDQLADPTDTTFIPRPEWYFLFLFQSLKLFTGPLEDRRQHSIAGAGGDDSDSGALYRSGPDDQGNAPHLCRRSGPAGGDWMGRLTAAAILTTPKEPGQPRWIIPSPLTGYRCRRKRWRVSRIFVRRIASVAIRYIRAPPG